MPQTHAPNIGRTRLSTPDEGTKKDGVHPRSEGKVGRSAVAGSGRLGCHSGAVWKTCSNASLRVWRGAFTASRSADGLVLIQAVGRDCGLPIWDDRPPAREVR